MFEEKGTLKKQYATRRADCRDCPLKMNCIGKGTEKRFSVVYHKPEYERAIARIKSPKGRYMKGRRQATVEPVFGVLTQYLAMRKVMTKGIHNANKQFKLAAIAYNLKKYLKFENKTVQPQRGELICLVAKVLNELFTRLYYQRSLLILSFP